MDKMEKLIATIMKEAEKDGEPVTYEEAKEMAEMELKTNADVKRYEKADKPRKKAEKVRKIDLDKRHLLTQISNCIGELGGYNLSMKNEVEASFAYNGNDYTIKLTKHRPPKK